MAQNTRKQLRWQGRSILEKDHGFDLDRSAALYEFKNKLPRQEAEEAAYSAYKRAQSLEGAAFHLAGMKAAKAVGAKEDAIKHSIAYGLHMKNLGLDPISEPPEEIKSRMDKHSRVYKFSPHDSDLLFVDKDEAPK